MYNSVPRRGERGELKEAFAEASEAKRAKQAIRNRILMDIPQGGR